jgi:uncharacterized protein YukE
MADIVFRYPEMRSAANNIREQGQAFKNAAQKFESDFTSAISNWEGESHDKMQSFINGAVMEYIGSTIPSLIEGLAALLEANADQMEKADAEIASNIPQSLG